MWKAFVGRSSKYLLASSLASLQLQVTLGQQEQQGLDLLGQEQALSFHQQALQSSLERQRWVLKDEEPQSWELRGKSALDGREPLLFYLPLICWVRNGGPHEHNHL